LPLSGCSTIDVSDGSGRSVSVGETGTGSDEAADSTAAISIVGVSTSSSIEAHPVNKNKTAINTSKKLLFTIYLLF
jgi:hypothetical protein